MYLRPARTAWERMALFLGPYVPYSQGENRTNILFCPSRSPEQPERASTEPTPAMTAGLPTHPTPQPPPGSACKKKMQALCAVMRKYLTGLWACLKADTPFDSTKLFSDCQCRDPCF